MNTATRTMSGHPIASHRQPVILFAIISLLLMSVGTNFFSLFIGHGRSANLTTLAMLIPLSMLMVLNPLRVLKSILIAPAFFLLLAVAVASFSWSYLPAITLERSVPLVITTMFAMSLGMMRSLRRLIILLACVGALAMVASLLAVIAIPGARGVPPWENTWVGIFNHKNGLGAASNFAALLLFGSAWLSRNAQRRWFIGLGLLAVFMLVASESRSSQIIFLLSVIVFVVGRKAERTALVWATSYLVITMATVAIVYLAIASGIMDPVFSALERKPTLSGRIPLWALVVPEMLKEFWLGYGYLGFWDDTSKRVIVISIHPTINFVPHYSHSGLIETWLNTGFVGVSLFVAGVMRAFWCSFVLLRHARDCRPAMVVIIVLVAFLLMNITESSVLARADYVWIAFVALCVGVSRAAQEVKRAGRLKRPNWRDGFMSGAQQTVPRI
jgi:exopolysaccharide production protein ExoQ